jgi:hypothetical protein
LEALSIDVVQVRRQHVLECSSSGSQRSIQSGWSGTTHR